jgi:hypothetical protein
LSYLQEEVLMNGIVGETKHKKADGLPPVFVPTSELVKTVSWHPHSFIGLATS